MAGLMTKARMQHEKDEWLRDLMKDIPPEPPPKKPVERFTWEPDVATP
jgi:hypothetical protein